MDTNLDEIYLPEALPAAIINNFPSGFLFQNDIEYIYFDYEHETKSIFTVFCATDILHMEIDQSPKSFLKTLAASGSIILKNHDISFSIFKYNDIKTIGAVFENKRYKKLEITLNNNILVFKPYEDHGQFDKQINTLVDLIFYKYSKLN